MRFLSVRFVVHVASDEEIPGDKVKYKILDGAEMMQMIGYDRSFLDFGFWEFASDDLSTIAGNAFNGFKFSAFFLAYFASLGQVVNDDSDCLAESEACESSSEDPATPRRVARSSSSSD